MWGASVHASAAAHPGRRTGRGTAGAGVGSLRTSRLGKLCDSGFWKHEPGWLSHEAFSRSVLPLPQLGAGHGLHKSGTVTAAVQHKGGDDRSTFGGCYRDRSRPPNEAKDNTFRSRFRSGGSNTTVCRVRDHKIEILRNSRAKSIIAQCHTCLASSACGCLSIIVGHGSPFLNLKLYL